MISTVLNTWNEPMMPMIGRSRLQTWFHDAAGNELCGAYYTYVRRVA